MKRIRSVFFKVKKLFHKHPKFSLFFLTITFLLVLAVAGILRSQIFNIERGSDGREELIDVYHDGIWYQVLGASTENNSHTYSNKEVKILVDGEELLINTTATILSNLFSENNISIGEYDKILPSAFTPVYEGLEIQIIRVEKVEESFEEEIPVLTEYRDNDNLYIGTENILEEGSSGLRLVTVEKEFEDGILVKEIRIGEKLLKESVNKVIEKGTKVQVLDVAFGKASYYYHPGYPGELITAHNSYPFGSMLRVTNLRNGRSVIVKVVDRGIHSQDRVVDLSKTAFLQIEDLWRGLANVKVELLAR